jgi:phosphatidylinositol alpha-1,6-mannosyltransferase
LLSNMALGNTQIGFVMNSLVERSGRTVDQPRSLFLTGSFPPPSAGGSVEYISNICASLAPGTATICTSVPADEPPGAFDRAFPQKVIRSRLIIHVLTGSGISRLRRGLEYVAYPLLGIWWVLREKPDVIHLGEFNYGVVAALIAKKCLGTPYVLYTYAEELTYLSTRPWHRRVLVTAIRNADAIVTVSEYTREILLSLGARPSRIRKILPAVSERKRTKPTPDEIEAVKRRYGLDGSPLLLTVGRLEARKGHASVMAVLPRVLEAFPRTQYIIAGVGPNEGSLKRTALEAGLSSSIGFLGRVPDDDLRALYEICDVFVMPHRQVAATLDTEGCPTVFLEASAHGKPVIGGSAGGVRDAIVDGETGLIVDGENADELAGAILRVLSDTVLAEQLGRAGRKYAETLRPEESARAVEAINRELCDRRTNRRRRLLTRTGKGRG